MDGYIYVYNRFVSRPFQGKAAASTVALTTLYTYKYIYIYMYIDR